MSSAPGNADDGAAEGAAEGAAQGAATGAGSVICYAPVATAEVAVDMAGAGAGADSGESGAGTGGGAVVGFTYAPPPSPDDVAAATAVADASDSGSAGGSVGDVDAAGAGSTHGEQSGAHDEDAAGPSTTVSSAGTAAAATAGSAIAASGSVIGDAAQTAVTVAAAAAPAADVTEAPNLLNLHDDVRRDVLSFLSGQELATTAMTCSQLQSACDDHHLWRTVYWNDFQPSDDREQMHAQTGDAKALYKSRLVEWRRRIEEQRRRLAEQARRMLLRGRQRRLRCCLDTWHIWGIFGLPVLAILITVGLVSEILDGERDATFAEAFSPVLLAASVAAVAFVLACVARKRDPIGTDETHLWHGSQSRRHVAGLVLREVGDDPVPMAHCTCMGVSAFLIPVFVVMKLDGVIDWNWGLVMLPLWLAVLLYTCAPCFKWAFRQDRDSTIIWMISVVALVAPLIATAITLVVKLDGADIALHDAFIPLWILDGLATLVGCVGYCGGCIHALRRGRRNDCREMTCAMFVGLIVATPIIVFEALLAVKDAGGMADTTWSSVTVPLIIFLLYGALGLCAASVALWRQNRRYRSMA